MPPSTSQSGCWSFCDGILPDVSRSFALIIPRCPEPINRGLCVAYLICRIVDTIEDEPTLERNVRSSLFNALLAALDAPAERFRIEAFLKMWPAIPQGDYGRLIEGTEQVLAAFLLLPPAFHPPIRHCVRDMIAGMRKEWAVQTINGIQYPCRNLKDLDEYCHYVAGVVGIMSTALFKTRIGGTAIDFSPRWHEDGRRLGLGLQMTNIIKDCHVDAERGISYIPPGYIDTCQTVYRLLPEGRVELIAHAIRHLEAGLRYTLAIPSRETGIRNFLLGSLLPAIATLEVAATGTEYHPKINRDRMAEILTLIDKHTADDDILRRWFNEHRIQALSSCPGAACHG